MDTHFLEDLEQTQFPETIHDTAFLHKGIRGDFYTYNGVVIRFTSGETTTLMRFKDAHGVVHRELNLAPITADGSGMLAVLIEGKPLPKVVLYPVYKYQIFEGEEVTLTYE